MLQGPGMHAVSIRNNEIHECEPWKRCLVRALQEKSLPKYLIWKLASKKKKFNKQTKSLRDEGALRETLHGHQLTLLKDGCCCGEH